MVSSGRVSSAHRMLSCQSASLPVCHHSTIPAVRQPGTPTLATICVTSCRQATAPSPSQAAGCRACWAADDGRCAKRLRCEWLRARTSHIILSGVQAAPVSPRPNPSWGQTPSRGIQATELMDIFSTFFFLLRAFASPRRPPGTCHCLLCPANGLPPKQPPARLCAPRVRAARWVHSPGEATNMAKFVSREDAWRRTRCPTICIQQAGAWQRPRPTWAKRITTDYTTPCPHASPTVGSCVRRTSPATTTSALGATFTSRMRSAVPQTNVSPSRRLAARPACLCLCV